MYKSYRENDKFQCFLAEAILRTLRSNSDLSSPANSVDSDQTAKEQSDQNLQCLFRHICPNI